MNDPVQERQAAIRGKRSVVEKGLDICFLTARIPLKTSLVISVIALVSWALMAVPPAFAGGTVIGTVTYTGKAEEKEVPLWIFPNSTFCKTIGTDGHKPDLVNGEIRIVKTIEVGKHKALKAAVVAVTDFEDTAFLDGYKGTEGVFKFCEFLPYTGVVVNKQNFHVENTDHDPDDPKSMKGVLHSSHALEVESVGYRSHHGRNKEHGEYTMDIIAYLGSPRTTFNISLPEKGSTIDRKVILRKENQGSFLAFVCDQHPWEQAYFLPVKNPYYAVTGADGSFRIEDVPAGKHKLIAWHPFAGQIEADVEVRDGTTVTANFQIKK